MSRLGRMRIGLRERLTGPCVDEMPAPPVIPGWRLIDIESAALQDAAEVLVVATVAVTRGRVSGMLTITPTADAFYVREVSA
jgi:hypothetical protein